VTRPVAPPVDLVELRRLAEAATSGPWRTDPGPDYDPTDWVIFAGPRGKKATLVAQMNPDPSLEGWATTNTALFGDAPLGDARFDNAAYIAAANPATILYLLDLLNRWVESHDSGSPAGLVMASDVCEETRAALQPEEPKP
jgi:hypothetical protein